MAEAEVSAPVEPRPILSIGITGHRLSHPALAKGSAPVRKALDTLLEAIGASAEAAAGAGPPPRFLLHGLLADGADMLAAEAALARGWQLVAPLPVGAGLYGALQSGAREPAEIARLAGGERPSDPAALSALERHEALRDRALLFELADADLRLLNILQGGDAADFDCLLAQRVALAGGVMLAHVDLLVAVWDGRTPGPLGGTADMVREALALGTPVVWLMAGDPDCRRLLSAPESLGGAATPLDAAALARVVEAVLGPPPGQARPAPERWHAHSLIPFHGYRRIEALFEGGGRPWRRLTQRYLRPEAVAGVAGRQTVEAARSVPGGDEAFARRIADELLTRFGWFDAVSTRLADLYRGGMTASFLMAAAAVLAGLSYQMFGDVRHKWMTASVELLLLVTVLALTAVGVRRRWHTRWLQTRRLAEYLRHAPVALLLGAGRPAARWPRSIGSRWPEAHARHALRALGLPRARVTPAYLRHMLEALLQLHVAPQRDYHRAKARRLATVHHRLDRLSEGLFVMGVATVLLYLILWLASLAGVVEPGRLAAAAKTFTFLGVAFPTLGGAVAGLRYFGDFERFANISEVAAGRLDALAARVAMLAALPDEALDYGRVAALAREADDVVIAEIESWQAVFGGKTITVPV